MQIFGSLQLLNNCVKLRKKLIKNSFLVLHCILAIRGASPFLAAQQPEVGEISTEMKF